jgi:hypothetical protein
MLPGRKICLKSETQKNREETPTSPTAGINTGTGTILYGGRAIYKDKEQRSEKTKNRRVRGRSQLTSQNPAILYIVVAMQRFLTPCALLLFKRWDFPKII